MDTIKTGISLLDLQEQKGKVIDNLHCLMHNPKLTIDYKVRNRARYDSQLESIQAQIDEWGTQAGLHYRIM